VAPGGVHLQDTHGRPDFSPSFITLFLPWNHLFDKMEMKEITLWRLERGEVLNCDVQRIGHAARTTLFWRLVAWVTTRKWANLNGGFCWILLLFYFCTHTPLGRDFFRHSPQTKATWL
jgi:hypothetical protein